MAAHATPAGAAAGAGPLVTCVVPSYNHARFLKRRIESVLGQTFRDFELVVIDDCSPDDSDAVIREILSREPFRYVRNERNSGTPFAAWERAAREARGRYLWICESDDVADPSFLSVAVPALEARPDAALFYCSSWIIDEHDARIDHTDTYFHDIWRETRWDQDFVRDGRQELLEFQLRGQIVPNMSSALIRTDAFRRAYHPLLKRFKLTGDWLFIGWVLLQGASVFTHQALSEFRRHETTSRVRVKSAQSQAEFVLTKYLLFRDAGQPWRDLAPLMRTDVIRFLHEPAGLWEVVRAMLRVSAPATLGFGLRLVASTALNRRYLAKFRERLALVKSLRSSSNT